MFSCQSVIFCLCIHAHSDRSANGFEPNILTSQPQGVAVGIFLGKKIKVREMSRAGSFMGKNFKCLNCQENRFVLLGPRGGCEYSKCHVHNKNYMKVPLV